MAVTIREAAGSLLVVGLGGTELTALERAWLKLVRPGGIILFRRNIADVGQTRALLNEATGLAARFGARCVDVEGGTVNRLRDALAPIASAQAVAAADRNQSAKSGKPALARKHGELIAQAVKAFGFNTTLAPVVDLTLPEATDVLGSRTTGATAADVIAYARDFLTALAALGVVGCGKHYPGLGGATGDTHFVTPAIERNWEQIWNEDTVPYRELHKLMPMIMTNHAAYPKTAGKNIPASASRFWIAETLRKKIGYKGIVFSDDLEMGGILKFLPVEQAAVEAIRAGSDLLEICHSAELILRTYEALIAEAERSSAFRKVLLRTAQECGRKRARLYRARPTPRPTAKALESLRGKILAFNDAVAAQANAAAVVDPRAANPAEAV
ncbi:beta-N-acetylhexosaminidase [Occallatibacter savannae]|uniref:beta-N-acetylhexosaminidase n=1 Tax=Occallatibacter savannae TaxID=1002691 RepID=UPI000D690642|nr:beta-N-acetylhexosaminidase [Occallatibacter savannae]